MEDNGGFFGKREKKVPPGFRPEPVFYDESNKKY